MSQPRVDWVNRLVRADNGALLADLSASMRGAVDLVYVDPPFFTGGGFSAVVRVGDAGGRAQVPVYEDRWAGMGAYLALLRARFCAIRDLLSDGGSLYVHLDYRAAARVRCMLDEVFGVESFVNEIVWSYKTGGMPDRLGFGRKHDTILFYAKDPARAIWNPQKEKSYLKHKYGFSNVEVHTDEQGPYTLVNCRDVFDIPALRGNQPERVDFPTQKPEALLERIVLASSVPGSIVADFFAGSGTTLVVAERLGRRFIGCDAAPLAVHTAAKRLRALPVASPFTIEDAAPPRYALRVRVSSTRGARVVALEGLEPLAADPLPVAVRALCRDYSDRIDAWEVSWRAGPDGPAGSWHVARTRRVRDLPLRSPPLALPRRGTALRVTAVDVLGHRTTVEVAR